MNIVVDSDLLGRLLRSVALLCYLWLSGDLFVADCRGSDNGVECVGEVCCGNYVTIIVCG